MRSLSGRTPGLWFDSYLDAIIIRDRDGLEVDAIAELPGRDVIGIEVKAATAYRGDHFNGLRKLRDRVCERFLAGVVLNASQRSYTDANRLYGLPLAALWEL